MEIRKLTDNDRNDFKRILRYCFETNLNNYENMEWPKDEEPMDRFYGAFEEGNLIAGSGIIPFEVKLRGSIFKMGGVDAVSTKPEYRNRGIIHQIFHQMFQDMNKDNIPISVLHPFKISYYEELGYKVADELVAYHFPITDIIPKKTNYQMKEVLEITEDIKSIYNEIVKRYEYIAIRAEEQWKGDFGNRSYKYICYDGDFPIGYVLLHFPKKDEKWWDNFRFVGESIYIREIYWLNSEAKQTIFNFIWSHRDQRKYVAGGFRYNENIIELLENPRVLERRIEVNSMLRIVNVKTVLENLNYPVKDFNLSIQVHDKHCPWNNKRFDLNSSNGKVSVLKEDVREDLVDLDIDIGHLGQILVGIRTPKELLDLNLVPIKPDVLTLLQTLFPRANNFFYEFF